MKADLPTLIAQVNSIASDTHATFGQLTPSQLNWKPSPERWSVAQCFEHLLTSNKGYFPIIDSVLAGQKPTLWQRMPVLPWFWGSLLVKSMDPSSTRKVKAPKKFQPSHSELSSSVIGEFIDQQNKIAEKMKATEHLDPPEDNHQITGCFADHVQSNGCLSPHRGPRAEAFPASEES